MTSPKKRAPKADVATISQAVKTSVQGEVFMSWCRKRGIAGPNAIHDIQLVDSVRSVPICHQAPESPRSSSKTLAIAIQLEVEADCV
jgi:hypothetical protein